MYQPMLYIHWKQVRLGLIPFMLAAFALPMLAIQGLGSPIEGVSATTLMSFRLSDSYEDWTLFFPLLATGVGMLSALSAWNWDHQLKHVYALSLPIPRWQYALLKMGAGAVIAALPALAFGLGSFLAAASLTLPSELHAYPAALTMRFLAATLVAYSAFFAAASGTVKTTLWVVSACAAYMVLGNLIPDFLTALGFKQFEHVDLVNETMKAFVSLPGPFRIFSGNWMLIDV